MKKITYDTDGRIAIEYTVYPLSKWPDIYVDFVNNYLTIEKWASDYNMSRGYAKAMMMQGSYTDNFSMNE
jgi:hypothetical protein